MSRSCLGRVSVLSLSFFGDVSVLFWCCFVVFLVVFWGSFSDVLVTSRACFGEVSVMCDGSVMFMMMSGWWLAVVSLMLQCCFYFCGDGVLIFCWTLMNILIGFLSKISNSNLNLYIVHLWENQCSCGSYVVGWCFKCFDVLVTSRACFGEISVMCVDGAVMFWWWVGDGLVLCRWCFCCFGDGVLIVWWWTLMNILIGFLSKISNSDLNLYIVHLWANQCSCDPYVDGESFKIEKFMLSVVSRSCLRDVSVLVLRCLGDVSGCHGDVSVLFSWCFTDVSGMSRWCFGDVSVLFQWCHDGDVSVLFS